MKGGEGVAGSNPGRTNCERYGMVLGCQSQTRREIRCIDIGLEFELAFIVGQNVGY